METHAHHLHKAPGKNFWHYFFEFFMLFLAVFCGFLVENYREHRVEKEKEEQFIKSLSFDLKDDVVSLGTLIMREKSGIASLDTLIDLLDNPQLAKKNGDQLYYVSRVGARSFPFANNSRTFDQLKNSGSFRLIRNSEASDKIMAYYEQFSTLRLLEDNYNHEFDNFKHVAAKVFDPGILRKLENENGEIQRSNFNPPLRTYDIELLKETEYHAVHMNGSRRFKIKLLNNLKKNAEALSEYLKKEYHLE